MNLLRLRRPVAALLLVAAVAAPGTAAAVQARKLSPEEQLRAKELYAGGAAAYKAEMFKDAETAFREVYHFTHAPAIFFDIAVCLERQRKWGMAADTFEAYLREAKQVADRKRIEARVVELRGRAERQAEIDPTGKQEPADQAALKSAPGNQMMKLGETEQGLLGLGEAEEAAPETPSVDEKTPVYKKWWLWVAVGGAAVAAIAIGVGVGVAARPGTPTLSPTTFPDVGPGSTQSALFTF